MDRLKAYWNKAKHDLVDYNSFIDRVKAGQRLTLQELRELDKMKFKGYEKIIKDENDEATRYLMGVINELREEQDKVKDIILEISETNEFFDRAYQHFDD